MWAESAQRYHSGCLSCLPNSLTDMQKTSDTKFADYQPHVAFFFPGQGAQAVGMAKVCSPCQLLGGFVCEQAFVLLISMSIYIAGRRE